MALITCVRCGKQISDIAETCGYCGTAVPQYPAANEAVDDGNRAHTTNSKDETFEYVPEPRRRNPLLTFILLLLLFAVAGLTYFFYKNRKSLPELPQSAPVASTDTNEARSRDMLEEELGSVDIEPEKEDLSLWEKAKEKASDLLPMEKVDKASVEIVDEVNKRIPASDEQIKELIAKLEARKREQEERALAEAEAQYRSAKQETANARAAKLKAAGTMRIWERRSGGSKAKLKAASSSVKNLKNQIARLKRRDIANSDSQIRSLTRELRSSENDVERYKAQLAEQSKEQVSAKAALEKAEKTYEECRTLEETAEKKVAGLTPRELHGKVARIVSTELVLLEMQRGGEPIAWQDGEAVAFSAVEFFDVAVSFDTSGLSPGQTVTFLGLPDGTWKADEAADAMPDIAASIVWSRLTRCRRKTR